jgi:hypothetical protein
MKLDCYLEEGRQIDIRPAGSRRAWMDETPASFAYRCLPLTIANAHGWDICCPVAFEAEWDGGASLDAVRIFADDEPDGGDVPDGVAGQSAGFVESHFGSGILTFNPMGIFRTDPGVNLWVSGPPNSFKDGVQPLSAVIETDWIPYNFTMNWKFTRPGVRVRFERGEPYCFVFPVPRGIVESCDPRLRPISAEPGLQAMHRRAYRERTFLHTVEASLGTRPVKDDKRLRFQGWYMAGTMPDGSEIEQQHQTAIEARPFRRTK